MRLHRFFVNSPIEYTKTIIKDEQLIHQWRNIFRYNVGSEVILFDGSGMEYDAVIEKMNNREAELRLVSERKGILPDKKIILFQSLIKKDKMEWVVEKATELGVFKIVPTISERSEKKSFNLERARKIAIEASEQCGRADVPEICEIQKLEITLNTAIVADSVIVFDPTPPPSPLPLARGGGTASSVSIFIGPEGGWTENEIKKFKDLNIKIFSLGNLTLRTETAAIVALTKIIF